MSKRPQAQFNRLLVQMHAASQLNELIDTIGVPADPPCVGLMLYNELSF